MMIQMGNIDRATERLEGIEMTIHMQHAASIGIEYRILSQCGVDGHARVQSSLPPRTEGL